LPDLREEALNAWQDANPLLTLLGESLRDVDDIGLEAGRQLCSFSLRIAWSDFSREKARVGVRNR
jgi:hypothetical protein